MLFTSGNAQTAARRTLRRTRTSAARRRSFFEQLEARVVLTGSDSFAAATLIPQTSTIFSDPTDNTLFTAEPGEPVSPLGNSGTVSTWWNLQVPTTGTVTINTYETNYPLNQCCVTFGYPNGYGDTTLEVFSGVALTPVTSNDDIAANPAFPYPSSAPAGYNPNSLVTFAATAGETYHIRLNGFGGDDRGLTQFNYTFNPDVVYVDDSFVAANGQAITDADLGTNGDQGAVFNVNAFTNLTSALAAVSASGTIIVNSGSYGETINLGSTRTLKIGGANVAQSVAINSVSNSAGSSIVIDGGSTLTVGDANPATIAGAISGSGNFTKVGSGVLTLQGANTYTGLTTVTHTGAPGVRLILDSAVGTSIPGNLTFDAWILVNQNNNQFGPTTVITFTGNNATGFAVLELLGHSQTVAGISAGVNAGYIENSQNGVSTGNSILTVNTLNAGDNFTYAGIIRNNADASGSIIGITKIGPGSLTLSNSVTNYTGATTVNGGRLKLTNSTAFNSAVAVNSPGTLEFLSTAANDTTADWGYTKALTGSGTVNKTGTGWLHFSGAIGLSGQVNVQGGKLSSGGLTANWSGNTAGMDISAGAVLDLNGNDITVGALTGGGEVWNGYSGAGSVAAYTLTIGAGGGSGTFNGAIRGTGLGANVTPDARLTNVVKTGAGTQVFGGTSTYGGSTTINGGVLRTSPSATRQAYQITTNTTGGQFHAGSLGYDFTVNAGQTATITQLGYYDSGLDGLVNNHNVRISTAGGASALALGVVPAGTAAPLSSGYRFVNLAVPLTLGPGTYTVWGDNYGVDPDLNNSTVEAGPVDGGGIITFVAGSGKWHPAANVYPVNADPGSPPLLHRYGAASFAFTGGVLPTSILPATTAVTVANGATFDLSGLSQTIGSLAGVAGASVTLGSGTLTVGNAANTDYAGVISGAGGLTKVGTGTLTLSGTNSYTGPTAITGGTLQVGNGGTVGSLSTSSAITVTSPATLKYSRNNLALAVDSSISGTGNVVFQGTGVSLQSDYVLGGNNAGFSGTMSALAARVQVNANNDVGTASLVASGGGQFLINGGTYTNPVSISGNGWLESSYPTGLGALRILSGANLTGPVTLTGNARVGQHTGESGTISGVISGGFGLEKFGPGDLILGGGNSNTYSGTTIVNQGILHLSKTGGAVAIAGPIQMGAGNANQPYLRMGQSNQFGPSVVMTEVNTAGNWVRFDLLGTSQTLAGIQDTAGGLVIQNGGIGVGAAGAATLTINNATDFTIGSHVRDFDNVASGKLNIIKTGNGMFTMQQVAGHGSRTTHTGTTTVDQGILVLNGLGDTGGGVAYRSPTTVNSGATLRTSGATTVQTVTPTSLTLNGGVYEHNSSQWIVWTGALTLSDNSTINVINNGASNQVFFDGGVAGTNRILTINNTGTATTGVHFRNNNTGTNSFSGTMIVNGGEIAIGSSAATWFANTDVTLTGAQLQLGVAAFAMNASGASLKSLNGNGTVTSAGSTTTLTLGTNNGSGSYSGTIVNGAGGALSFIKTGTGTQILTSPNSFTGTTQVTSGGILQVSDLGAIGQGTGANWFAVQGDATFRYTGSGTQTTTARDIYWNSGAATFDITSPTGVAIFNTTVAAVRDQAMTKLGPGKMTLASSVAGVTLATTGTMNLSAGTFEFQPNTLTTAMTATNTISGPGSLNKSGVGTLLLHGSSNYGGPTSVLNGTLGGDGSITSAITVSSGATLAPGAIANAGDFATGALMLSSGANYTVQLNGTAPGTQYDQTIAPSVSLGGAALVATSSVTPVLGQVYTIISNTGGATSGQFIYDGILRADGASIDISGLRYYITYNDPLARFGTLNDVALIRNRAVTAAADSFLDVVEDVVYNGNVKTNDTDPDGDGLVSIVDGPDNADVFSMDPVTGIFTYRANANFSGTDSFSYINSDGDPTIPPVTVTVNLTINAVADVPNLAVGNVEGFEGTAGPVVMNVTSSLVDSNGTPAETLSIVISGVPVGATLSAGTPSGGGTIYTLTPAELSGLTLTRNNNSPADATFTLTAVATATEPSNNSQASTAPLNFTVKVKNAPPAPVQNEVYIDGVLQGGNPSVIISTVGLPITFVVSTTDPSFPLGVNPDPDAPFTFSLNWGDGTIQPAVAGTVQTTAEGQTVSFTYDYFGKPLAVYQPKLTVTDSEGASTTINLATVTLSNVFVVNGTMFVGGGAAGERIVVLPASGGGAMVRIDNVPSAVFLGVNKVIVYGNGGGDTISNANLPLPVEFYGGPGNDYLAGGVYDDILDGGADSDRVLGGLGNDTLLGGAGNDTLSGASGNDYSDGDAFLDLNSVLQLPPLALQGRDTIGGENGDDIAYGRGGNDTLNGGLGNDFLRGGEGNDTVNGDAGNDVLTGDAGGDKLTGRDGTDVLLGGEATDLLYGGGGDDLTYASDLLNNTDAAINTIASQWFAGNKAGAANTLSANKKNDTVSDSLYGEAGTDWYLLFLLDKITTSTDKPTNSTIINL